jgi:S-adenosylmethionine synthetase
MAEHRRSGVIPWLGPDCKAQVVLQYERCRDTGKLKPLSIHTVLISSQHKRGVPLDEIRQVIHEKIVKPVCPAELIREDTRVIINPSGSFIMGGPAADTGLTGRKIIVDTYGGWASHGGGAFSGKDPTKVDRSANLYARYVAKSLVAAGLCHRAQVQLSYAIGVAEPLSVYIDTFGSARNGLSDEEIEDIAKKNFDFRPGNMINELDLLRPIYEKTAKYGAFGRKNDPDFTWETPKKLKLE